uniref:Uncharacterized protein n=1 Tax=Oryza sativa subsp. japonica TaxID=39947 RepID=Q6ERQ3_ORYSJ|nr:hypothetical protein [Oryza sativa Japonica Group]BAD33493.1 hypothetical protein [Oryza sativa Japonica Group]
MAACGQAAKLGHAMAELGQHGARAIAIISDRIDGSEELPRDGRMTKIGCGGGAEKKVQHAHKVFDEMFLRE